MRFTLKSGPFANSNTSLEAATDRATVAPLPVTREPAELEIDESTQVKEDPPLPPPDAEKEEAEVQSSSGEVIF